MGNIFLYINHMLVTNIVSDILKVHTAADTGSASYLGEKTPMHKH